MSAYPLTHIERRLLAAQDNHLRRCWFCGEWAYRDDECSACTAPSTSTQTQAHTQQRNAS